MKYRENPARVTQGMDESDDRDILSRRMNSHMAKWRK